MSKLKMFEDKKSCDDCRVVRLLSVVRISKNIEMEVCSDCRNRWEEVKNG